MQEHADIGINGAGVQIVVRKGDDQLYVSVDSEHFERLRDAMDLYEISYGKNGGPAIAQHEVGAVRTNIRND